MPVARFTQKPRAVRISNDGFEMQFAVALLCKRTDRNLTASPQAAEQRALAGCRGASGWIVQELQVLARGRVALADFDAQRSLPRSRTHDFRRDNLLDQLRLAQPLQPG